MGVERLTDNLCRLHLGAFQAYLWRDADGVTLVDSGAADAGGLIALALDELGLAPQDVRRVVLTHFHDDHAGSAAEIRDWGEVEIVAHRADAPIIRGDIPAPAPQLPGSERALHAPAHGVLFTGDTVAERFGRLVLGVFNVDTAQTAQSMRRLAGLDADIAVFGHGEPVVGGAAARLRQAVDALPG